MALKAQLKVNQFANSTANRFMGMSNAGVPGLISQFLAVGGNLTLPTDGLNARSTIRPQHVVLGPASSGSFAFANWFTANDSAEFVMAFVVGVKPDGSGAFSGLCCATFKKDGAADAVIVGASQTLFLQEDISGAPTIALSTAGGNQLNIDYVAAENVNVTATILAVRV